MFLTAFRNRLSHIPDTKYFSLDIHALFGYISEKYLETKMTKSDLITALAAKENLAEKTATDIIELLFDGFTETLKNGDKIEIRGFGSFSVREYESYMGRNPKTGTNIDVKPKKLPFFKVGKELKAMVK